MARQTRSENKFYKFSEKVRGAGNDIELTPQQVEETVKCMRDPVYFINNYVHIVTLDGGLGLFKLYDCQVEKINFMHDNRRVIIMEGRQQGKTTATVAYILWYMLFNEHKTVLIMANKKSSADEAMKRFRTMYENLPMWLQHGVTKWNQGNVEIENGSSVYAFATTAGTGRSKSANLIYVDEAAHIQNSVADAFFTSVHPVMSAGHTTKMILSSTPLGFNHFWRYWDGAKFVEEKKPEKEWNGFMKMFIHYSKIPGRDERWVNEQKRVLGDLKFTQEILCEFVGSTLTLIDGVSLNKMKGEQPLKSIMGLDVYRVPQPTRTYMMTVDVAEGIGEDSSAAIVTDITETPFTIVAKYKDNRVKPPLLPNILNRIGRDYNNAYILIEINNNPTVAYIMQHEMEYESLLFVNRKSGEQRLGGGFGGSQFQLGLTMDKKTKRIGCHYIKALIEEDKYIVSDRDTIQELMTFVERQGTYSADEGYHDDLAMCLVIFGWAASCPYFNELQDFNLREDIFRQKMQLIEQELTPFGFNSNEDAYIDEYGNSWGRPGDEIQTLANF